MALKKKEIQLVQSNSGAFALPEMMTAMTTGLPVYELPINTLENAPNEWNFFKKLPDGKFLELCQSIAEQGLISPLLVWEKLDGKRMILTGHNRRRALESLYQVSKDEKYLTAPCIVRKDLTDGEAQTLLIDSNWVQRTLSPSEKARCVARKYTDMGRKSREVDENKGKRTYDIVASHFGLKATQVYYYLQIASLPEEVLETVDSGDVSLKAASALAKLSHEECLRIKKKLGASFNTEHILEEISPKEYVKVVFKVPRDMEEEVRKVVEEMVAGL